MFKHLSLAQEAIDFQPSGLFKDLALTLKALTGQKRPNYKLEQEVTKVLSTVTKRYTNLTIVYKIAPEGSHVMMDHIDTNNMLMAGRWMEGAEKNAVSAIRLSGQTLKGTIDLKTSRVSGVFASAVARIVLDSDLIYRFGFTAKEMASIALHEIGHVFTLYELMDRTASTNQVLAALDYGLKQETQAKKKEYLFDIAGEALGFERTVVQDIKASASDTTAFTIFMTEAYGRLRSATDDITYDANSFEMMADQFAARHGAGVDLATGLDKLNRLYDSDKLTNPAVYYAMEIAKYAMGSLTVAMGVALTFPEVITRTNYGGMIMVWALGTMGSQESYLYDKDAARLTRIRRQLVEYAKTPEMDRGQVEQLTEDLKVIDAMIAKYNQNEPLINIVGKFFSTNISSRQKSEKLHKDLEAIALNDLFVKAAELKHL